MHEQGAAVTNAGRDKVRGSWKTLLHRIVHAYYTISFAERLYEKGTHLYDASPSPSLFSQSVMRAMWLQKRFPALVLLAPRL